MYIFIVTLHVFLCVFMVLVIMLQPGKGGDVGAAFGGGGSSSMFGPRGPTNLLQQATTGVAVLFLTTSTLLALYSNPSKQTASDLDSELEALAKEAEAAQQEGEPAAP